jgi:hypothetical protein
MGAGTLGGKTWWPGILVAAAGLGCTIIKIKLGELYLDKRSGQLIK